MAIKFYKPTTPGRRGMTVTDYSALSKVDPEKSLLAPLNKKRRPQQLRPHHRPPPRRRTPPQVPHHRLQEKQARYAGRDGADTGIRPQPQPQTSRWCSMKTGRSATLWPSAGPEGRRYGCLGRFGRHQAGQRSASVQHPDRYVHPQRGAVSGQGRAAGPQRRYHGSADGQRKTKWR